MEDVDPAMTRALWRGDLNMVTEQQLYGGPMSLVDLVSCLSLVRSLVCRSDPPTQLSWPLGPAQFVWNAPPPSGLPLESSWV